jgi:hypothetical protein
MGWLTFLKRTAASVPTPASGKASIFVDSSTGEPSYKDDAGTTRTLRVQSGTVVALSIASGVVAIDLQNGASRNFTLLLTANVTSITFSNLPASGYVGEVEIQIKQDATGSRTLALPAAFKALGDSDIAIASAANAVTVLSAKTWDQGTTWRYAMQESA